MTLIRFDVWKSVCNTVYVCLYTQNKRMWKYTKSHAKAHYQIGGKKCVKMRMQYCYLACHQKNEEIFGAIALLRIHQNGN